MTYPEQENNDTRPWRLLDYQPIGRIANGGMAEVWLARHSSTGGFQRLVAIKRLHAHHSEQSAFVAMFLHEARLAAFIHHPNVVPILETREIAGDYYLVLDYIEGTTLSRLRRRAQSDEQRIPKRIVSRIMIDSLSGLHAAHIASDHFGEPLKLIHRDCTPQNILVGVDGCSRLTDFGVARAAARLDCSQDGTLKGKVAYMAPEQAQQDTIDRRADLFSMGAVLWELYRGERLFHGETEAAILSRVLTMKVPSLLHDRDDIAPVVDRICQKALQRDPTQRFSSARAMADSIERAAHVHASAANGDSGIASHHEVSDYVNNMVGDEMNQRRERVRAWMTKTPTSTAPPPSVWDDEDTLDSTLTSTDSNLFGKPIEPGKRSRRSRHLRRK